MTEILPISLVSLISSCSYSPTRAGFLILISCVPTLPLHRTKYAIDAQSAEILVPIMLVDSIAVLKSYRYLPLTGSRGDE